MGFFVIEAFWLVIAAYLANAFPVILRGKKPLDFGKKLKGKRILGDGKTIKGTIGGILFGVFIGSIQVLYQSQIPVEWGLNLATITFPMVILLSTGAIVGDIIGAFIKRRLNIPRGEPAVLLDQLDFLATALVFLSVVFIPEISAVVFLLVITPIIHWFTNIIGYKLKLKQRPW